MRLPGGLRTTGTDMLPGMIWVLVTLIYPVRGCLRAGLLIGAREGGHYSHATNKLICLPSGGSLPLFSQGLLGIPPSFGGATLTGSLTEARTHNPLHAMWEGLYV